MALIKGRVTLCIPAQAGRALPVRAPPPPRRIVKFVTAPAKYAQLFTRERLCCIKPDQEDACFSEGFMLQTTRSFLKAAKLRRACA